MEEKLLSLYKESIDELKSIGIDLKDEKNIGKIDIAFSKRNNKRYGCCRQEKPDTKTAYKVKRKIYYKSYNIHHIEISKWVMELTNEKIKNTIIHELIHCLPECNNHGTEFKKYAKIVNEKLGYNISRLGDKRQDFVDSNLEFKEENLYKYKIQCIDCNQLYYRKKLLKNFIRKYRCGKCNGKLIIIEQKRTL